MNAFLVATMVLGAAATENGVEAGVEFKMTTEVDETALRSTAEFIQIEHTMTDIADRISSIKLKETDFNFGAFDWMDNDGSTNGDSDNQPDLWSSLLEKNEKESADEDYKKADKKRACKVFEDTRLVINAKDKFAKVIGSTWESCLKSCEENSLCAQVIFDKDKQQCNGFRIANSKTATGYTPEKFISGHCKTATEGAVSLLQKTEKDIESAEDTSMLQTEDKSEVQVDAATAEFEEQMKMEEQLAKEERAEKAAPKETAQFWQDKAKEKMKPKGLMPMKPSENYWSQKSSLKLRQKISKKCTTFETENLMKKGSLLQMGKKLLTSETTGDFLTCLQKCQKDATCKQVVYDKQASQCYKHDEVVVKKSDAKGTKYIAATCQ